MILNYKTGNLPPNFIYLGVLLLGVSIWRIIVLDWIGLLFLVISLLCLFIKSGIIIDTDNKKLKKYIGIFTIRKGKWENISTLNNLQIIKVRETQSMNVLSINRTETKDVYKLILVLPNKNIELMSGENNYIINTAKKISLSLQTTVINRSK